MGFKYLSALARGLIFLSALGILFVGLSRCVAKDAQVVSSTPKPTQTYTPTVTATPMPTPTPVPGVPSVGMSLGISDPVALSRVRDAGVRWVRTSIAWSSVEPSNLDLTDPANGDWPDGWFQTLVSTYDFTPEVIVWKNPGWAASTTCGPIDRTSLSEFAEFVRALAARYDGDGDYDNDGTVDSAPLPEVLYFELYNEADFDLNHPDGEADYGGCWGQAPTAYAEMLRAAYLAMKAGNPRVQVLFGSIAYDRFTAPSKPSGYPGPTGPFDYNFTQAVLTYLYNTYPGDPNLPFFDVMNFHYYNDFRNAYWDGTMPYDQELLGKMKHIKDNQLYKAGVYDLRNMPFLCSEISLPSAPTDQWTERNEVYQSDYMAQAYVPGMAAGLVANLWFTLADYTQLGRGDQIYDWLMYGVLCSASVDQASDACSPNPLSDYTCSVNFEPKPAYQAIQALNVEMAGATYDRQLDPSETGSANIMAFRFNKADGRKKIVAWTDTGERIGKKGVSPLTIDMDFNASHFGGEWTGQLRVVDKLGNEHTESGVSSISIDITQSPIYVEVVP